MNVTEIWRYPVKTMAGEQVQHVRIGPLGIEGDRVVHVENVRGEVVTSRSYPRFLGHHSVLGVDGEPLGRHRADYQRHAEQRRASQRRRRKQRREGDR